MKPVFLRGVSLFFAVELLIAPQFSTNVLKFTLVDERVASLRLWVGERVLTVVCAYATNIGKEYPPFLKSFEKVLDSAPTGNDRGLSRGVTGRNRLPDLTLSGVQLLDFCVIHSWSITNTMFCHKSVHKCT